MNSYAPYLDWIHSQDQILLQRVKEWVSINTFTYNLEGLALLMENFTSSFKILQGEMKIIPLPSIQILNSKGIVENQQLGKAFAISKRPQAPIQILLGGHMDTVYLPSSHQKMEKDGNGIWKGPGAADMKGGLAILLTTLEALERSPYREKIGWQVLITPDEEIGSPGSAHLYEQAAQRNQLGLIFEPSFPDGAFVSSRMGSANITLIVKGKAAHVGRDFEKGRSAVYPLARFINQVETLKDQDLILNIAEVEAKGPVNIVPPLATCRVNIRSLNPSSLQKALIQITQFAKENEEEGIQIKLNQDSFRPPKPFDSAAKNLFEAYGNCAKDLNIPFQIRSTGGVCDGNLLAGAGLPTLDTAGVVGGALHTPDEYFIESALVERAKLAGLFLLKLANEEIKAAHG